MITLLVIFGTLFILAFLIALMFGLVVLSPIALIVLGFILLDIVFIKMIFKKKKK